ncbi:MAG: hypothetical protein JST93_00720 [Acidobacteria bacterium]|nr:hypothetical protein [Acidobacteriota bacterium]
MLPLTLFLIGLWSPAQAQKAPYDCGNLHQKACGYRDFEYYNITWGLNKCEKDLEERDGVCFNKNRVTRPKETGWLGWAMREQLYGISLGQPINRIPWLGAHNAFSSKRQGFSGDLYANQVLSLTDQLNAGVRHLELDPHYYTYAVPPVEPAARLCHGSNTGLCLLTNYGNRLLGFALAEIRAWLRANPSEVLILKLDEKNVDSILSVGYDFMYSELNTYLGPYAYRPTGAFSRWPTIAEIRGAGKQIVIMQHDSSVRSAGADLVWDAHLLIQSNNWPKNQDFDNCVSQDGVSQANRGAKEWWDVAEGRSLSNSDAFNNATGLMGTGTVRKAVNCGVSIIGLDYLYALSSAPVGNQPSNFEGRVESTIWSFAEGDYGFSGPAYLNKTTRRWNSAPATEVRPYACAPKRPSGDPNDVRDWRISAVQGEWNQSYGNAMCAAEFGTDFEFAHPRNGFQNRQLADLAANTTNGVWVKYATKPQEFIAASSTEVTFTTAPGAPPAPAQALDFYAFVGSQAEADSNVPWLRVQVLNATVPLTGVSPVLLTPVSSVVSQMAPGEYPTTVVLRSRLNVGSIVLTFSLNVDVKLIIRKPVSLSAAPEATPVSYGLRARVIATLPQLSPKISGSLSFVRTSAQDPAATAVTTDAIPGQYADFTGLPAGKHRFGVSYSGDAYYLPAESNEIEIEVLPRIRVTPTAVTFAMDFGGAVPPGQTLTVAGAAAGLAATRPCGWLTVTVQSQTQIGLSLVSAQVQALAPGAYPCDVTVSDSLSATQSSTIVPVVLNVRTTLSASPSNWDVVTANDAVAREVFVTTPGNRTAALSAVSNQPWLTALVPNGATPTNMVLTVNPQGLAPGTYAGRVTLTSPLSTNSAFVDVTFRVVRETVVDTAPSGLRVIVDGAPLTAPASFVWTPGSQHQISADTFQEIASSGIRHRFGAWQHGGAQTQVVAAGATGGATYLASYAPEYRLSTDLAPAASGSVLRNPAGDGSGYYAANTPVQLTASANAGKAFTHWSGNAGGSANPVVVTMNAPKSAVANFTDLSALNFTVTSPVPTSITVNGIAYAVPGTVPMVPGLSYALAAPPEVAGGTGTRWVFQSWQGLSSNASFSYVAPSGAATIALLYQQQHLVSVNASPGGGGTVTGAGWINAGSPATIQATAASGFVFSGFSGGGLSSASGNPATIAAVTGPLSIVANFTTTGTPNLYATTSGARTDGAAPGSRVVSVVVRNLGSGPAADAVIEGITNIVVTGGSGAVSALSAVPVALGTIAGGGQAGASLLFQWPTTATRVQFTLRFTANNGAYSGTTTLTLFR